MDSLPALRVPSLSRAEELNAKGAEFFRDGHMEPARLHFLAALSLEPNQPQVLQNLGAVLRNLNHFEAAESVARRSVVASGSNPYARSNLGVSQLALKKYDEALETLKGVTKDMPDSGPSWHNYGLALYMMGRYVEALEAFDKSIKLDHCNAQVLSDRALTLLALQRLKEGLEAYEVRWMLLAKNKIWEMGIPEWQGEPLEGQRILVHHEQGYGDSLMLVRLVEKLAVQTGQVTLAVPPALCRLFERSIPARIISLEDAEKENPNEFDFHTPLLSVMRWLGFERPSEISAKTYLVSGGVEDKITLPFARTKIGICWASGNHGAALAERRRMVPLTSFLPISELPGVQLVSLQVGQESGDIVNNGLEGIVFDISAKLTDFAATADVIADLDLVISVDSAVAHLTGAMGKTCLMLSPYTRCWRWWNQTSGLPWYRNMTIFRQSQNGKWDEAMRHITKALKSYVERPGRHIG